jgi:hypothetical protein
MMYDSKGHSCVVLSMSRYAGTCVGTLTTVGRKITGIVVSGMTGLGHLICWPVRTSETIAVEPEAKHSLERSRKELYIQSESLSSTRNAQTKHSLPISVEEITEDKVGEKGKSTTATVLMEPGEQATTITKERFSPPAPRVKTQSVAAVTNKQIQAADFDNETERIIFTKALSDIKNQDGNVRADAVKTIAGIRHELSVQALSAHMACEQSAQVRQECIKALATLEMKEALPTVENALTDEAGSVRLAAVWCLYRLSGAESAPALIRMLSDEDEEVRRRAATCIGWLGRKELAIELLPLLNDNSISVRRATAEAMGNLHNNQVVSSLIERLQDPDKPTRKTVLGAIEAITDKKMSKSFPKNQRDMQRLAVRWQEWWKEELLK